MKELITILDALREELRPMIREPTVYDMIEKCRCLVLEAVSQAATQAPKITQAEKLALLQGKVEAYENALSLFKNKV